MVRADLSGGIMEAPWMKLWVTTSIIFSIQLIVGAGAYGAFDGNMKYVLPTVALGTLIVPLLAYLATPIRLIVWLPNPFVVTVLVCSAALMVSAINDGNGNWAAAALLLSMIAALLDSFDEDISMKEFCLRLVVALSCGIGPAIGGAIWHWRWALRLYRRPYA